MKIIVLALFMCSCSATQQKTATTIENDLCSARTTFKALEAIDSSLTPAPNSPRANVEKLEDTLCSAVVDGG